MDPAQEEQDRIIQNARALGYTNVRVIGHDSDVSAVIFPPTPPPGPPGANLGNTGGEIHAQHRRTAKGSPRLRGKESAPGRRDTTTNPPVWKGPRGGCS